MALLANKQSDLEKLIKNLIKQNEKFQKDNKYLWNELMKNKYVVGLNECVQVEERNSTRAGAALVLVVVGATQEQQHNQEVEQEQESSDDW